MYLGKQIRLERIFKRSTKKTIFIPMDHGISIGSIEGSRDLQNIVEDVADAGANAIITRKGLARDGHRQGGRDIGLIMHLCGSTDFSLKADRKILLTPVIDAVRYGADAVSFHVNLGGKYEDKMMYSLGKVSHEAEEFGMPLIAMIQAKGPLIANPLDPKVIAHCVCVGEEIGADVIKVPYTGDPDSFHSIVEKCKVPIVIAREQTKYSPRQLLQRTYEAMQAGASGVSIGRNVFQHKNPSALIGAISSIVHMNISVQAAMEIIVEE